VGPECRENAGGGCEMYASDETEVRTRALEYLKEFSQSPQYSVTISFSTITQLS